MDTGVEDWSAESRIEFSVPVFMFKGGHTRLVRAGSVFCQSRPPQGARLEQGRHRLKIIVIIFFLYISKINPFNTVKPVYKELVYNESSLVRITFRPF